MAKQRIQLVPDEEIEKVSIMQQIEEGIITEEVYKTLSPQEQGMVRQALFERYSTPVIPAVSLSSLEFTIFGLAKLFFKIADGVELTPDESQFFERFRQYVEQHEITLNPADWYVPYAEQNMLIAQRNRLEYKQKKMSVTGEF